MVRTSSKVHLGATRASVDRLEASTAIAHNAVNEIEQLRATELSAYFEGDSLVRWAGSRVTDTSTASHDDGRLKSMTITLLESEASWPCQTTPTLSLSLQPHWHATHVGSSPSSINTSLRVTISAPRPRLVQDLLEPILHVQDLLNIAFRSSQSAAMAKVKLDAGQEDGWGDLWNAQLMRPQSGGEATGRAGRADFALDHLGGPNALCRWTRLCRRHPRAVRPLADRHRIGRPTPEVACLEVAAALEYWVATHRRSRRWAHQGETHAHAIALLAGDAFHEWCGDSIKWATRFWGHYRGLKHAPRFQHSRKELGLLTFVGETLLQCILLNRVAGSDQPTRSLLRSPGMSNVKEAVQEVCR